MREGRGCKRSEDESRGKKIRVRSVPVTNPPPLPLPQCCLCLLWRSSLQASRHYQRLTSTLRRLDRACSCSSRGLSGRASIMNGRIWATGKAANGARFNATVRASAPVYILWLFFFSHCLTYLRSHHLCLLCLCPNICSTVPPKSCLSVLFWDITSVIWQFLFSVTFLFDFTTSFYFHFLPAFCLDWVAVMTLAGLMKSRSSSFL